MLLKNIIFVEETTKRIIMHAYRFRLLSDEIEDFAMDIEIRSNQTFKDFHDIIRQTARIKDNELASFFICNNKWQKQKEITLIDMGDAPEDASFGEDSESFDIPISTMEESRISDFIDDPHQRLLYDYDILNQRSLYIELMKIFEADKEARYPACTKKKGALEPSKKNAGDDDEITPPDVDANELLKEFEEMINGDEDLPEGDVYLDE